MVEAKGGFEFDDFDLANGLDEVVNLETDILVKLFFCFDVLLELFLFVSV